MPPLQFTQFLACRTHDGIRGADVLIGFLVVLFLRFKSFLQQLPVVLHVVAVLLVEMLLLLLNLLILFRDHAGFLWGDSGGVVGVRGPWGEGTT